MRPALFFVLALVLQTSVSQAKVISTRTNTRLIETVTELGFSCKPGVAPNGHNYPTQSYVELFGPSWILGETNVVSIWANDPKNRMGNHCPELTREFAEMLPAQLALTSAVTERVGLSGGSA